MWMTTLDWFLVAHFSVSFAVISYFAIRAERAERREQPWRKERRNRRVTLRASGRDIQRMSYLYDPIGREMVPLYIENE